MWYEVWFVFGEEVVEYFGYVGVVVGIDEEVCEVGV